MSKDVLPGGWVKIPLSDVGDWIGGGTPSKSQSRFWDGSIPWVSPKDMKVPVISDTEDHISADAVKESAAKLIPAESVLFVTRSGILAHSFPVATTKVPVTVNQDLKAIVPGPYVDASFLAWCLRAQAREILDRCTKDGTTVHSIEIPSLRRWPVPVPPLDEQRRIVAKIEALFSELDQGIAALKTAREQLKVYRQAVLKHAFEGKLTARWREENPDKLESSERLLLRIQQERMSRYQEELERWKRAVQSADKTGKKLQKPSKLDLVLAGEPELHVPECWAECEVGSLAYESVLGKMLDKQKNVGILRPYLGNINVRWGTFDLQSLKTMRIEDAEVERYGLVNGDLVICEGGEPGRCAVWNGGDWDVFIQKALHRVRFTESYDPWFAYYFLLYGAATQHVGQHFTGTTIKHLTGAGLRKIKLPVCSRDEQREILARLEEILSAVDAQEEEIDAALIRGEALRQSILKKAFLGQLVPQDSNDEPAAVLLERIRAEKAAQTKPVQARRRKATA